MRLRFGDCVFDGEARTLSRGGAAVALSPRAFELLQALLEQRPRVVSRQALHDRIWPRTFVSETSLPRLVTELRKALGDTREAAGVVRTVHGFGYAFAGQAVPDPPAPDDPPAGRAACEVALAGETLPLFEGENLVGRGAECRVRVDASEVSRLHARILVAGSEGIIEDLASKNGTFVNGQRVTGPRRLASGDQIGLGSAVLVFVAHAESGSTATHRRG
jgi:DNA-binding winged helix-turn-helix (wHTH) protein